MSLPDQTPKLPKLPFVLGDVLLLAVAWFIVYQADGPLSTQAIIAIVACVIVASVLGSIPFYTDYARKQDEALDERQRGLEALSRTINTAAEQISIAANGINEITEHLHRNLKHAEQLPQRLQEKIAEFNAQLDNAREEDREELEKEVAELRSSETERLQAIADRIHKAVAELGKLEAAAQKHVAERTDLIERANAAAAKAHGDAGAALKQAAAALAHDLAAAQAKAAAEIDSKLAAAPARALAETETRLNALVNSAVAKIDAAVAAATAAAAAAHVIAAPAPAAPAAPQGGGAENATGSEIASPPKRPRKARRDEPATNESLVAAAEPATEPTEITAAEPAASAAAPAAPHAVISSTPANATMPPASEPSAPAESHPATPAVPPAAAAAAPQDNGGIPAAVAAEPALTAAPAEPAMPSTERAPRKRRKSMPEPGDLTLELGGAEFASPSSDDAPVTSSEVVERVISSDGATRLIATAYIGIGNRLFIRGDGPGLSWEKGVPLQFVSIGKWRWETADATAPIQAKLYKNDEIECSALGTLTLEPGHQEEVTAKF